MPDLYFPNLKPGANQLHYSWIFTPKITSRKKTDKTLLWSSVIVLHSFSVDAFILYLG